MFASICNPFRLVYYILFNPLFNRQRDITLIESSSLIFYEKRQSLNQGILNELVTVIALNTTGGTGSHIGCRVIPCLLSLFWFMMHGRYPHRSGVLCCSAITKLLRPPPRNINMTRFKTKVPEWGYFVVCHASWSVTIVLWFCIHKYTMYPWSLQANLFMRGQCIFAIDLCNTIYQWEGTLAQQISCATSQVCCATS